MAERIPTTVPVADREASSRQEEDPWPVESVAVVGDSSALPEKESNPATDVVVECVSKAAVVVEKEEPLQPAVAARSTDAGKSNSIEDEEQKIPETLISFKEESNRVSDLADSDRKALEELRQLVVEENGGKEAGQSEKKVSIWGVPLLEDERTDVILLKFLRAREFEVRDAFVMFRNTIRWREEFGIDSLVDENLGDDLEKVVFMHGYSRESHPVCYNVFGEFQNKDLYTKTFSDQEKRTKFLRWRIQFLERSVRKLDFHPGGISTIFQVNDLKNSPGPGKRELRLATKQALQVLQDNYPEFVAKQVFINVPWWYLAFYTMISPFLTQRTKSKFIFAGPTKSADTLFKYISPEHVPIEYGGLSVDSCDCNPDFDASDQVTQVSIKPSTKQTVEIIIYEKCTIDWELRVGGWEVSYSAEFVPNTDEAYTVIIQKARKMAATDEPVISQSFKVCELGKVLLTIDNPTSKKKKLLYRFKVKVLRE